jgi:hypothetical protein
MQMALGLILGITKEKIDTNEDPEKEVLREISRGC